MGEVCLVGIAYEYIYKKGLTYEVYYPYTEVYRTCKPLSVSENHRDCHRCYSSITM